MENVDEVEGIEEEVVDEEDDHVDDVVDEVEQVEVDERLGGLKEADVAWTTEQSVVDAR